jgi:hypothetical protein
VGVAAARAYGAAGRLVVTAAGVVMAAISVAVNVTTVRVSRTADRVTVAVSTPLVAALSATRPGKGMTPDLHPNGNPGGRIRPGGDPGQPCDDGWNGGCFPPPGR